MKKLLHFITAAAIAVAPAAVAQNLSVEGVEGEFKTFQDAFNAIETEGTINVLQDFTATPAKKADGTSNENAALLVGAKKITVNGNGHTIDFATFYMFNLKDAAGSLNVNNLTLNYTKGETASTRGAINVGRGSINLTDVTISNLNVASSSSVISLNNSNSYIPSASLNGVKMVNCTTTSNAEVLLANNNLTIDGDCAFSLYVNNANTLFTPSAGSNIAGNVSLIFAKTEVGNTAVRNCTNTNVFTLTDENLTLKSDGTNLVIAEKKPEQNYPVYIGETGYETLNAAITAVEDGGEAVIELKEDITLTSNLSRTAGKTIIVNGNGYTISRGDIGARFMAVTNTATTSLTFNNVTLDGGNAELTVAAFQPSSSASLTLKDVTFANFNTTNARGIIDAANGGKWHLDGVKFVDCTVANQDVTTNNSAGCTISGDNSLTLRINGAETTVAAEGVANAEAVAVTLGATPVVDRVVFTGCSDAGQFSCANDGYVFITDGNNLKIGNQTTTGIAGITNDTTLPARYYNLQGIEVPANTLSAGLYIEIKGTKKTKIQVR